MGQVKRQIKKGMDIRNKEEIEPVFSGADYIFHFATPADIVPSIQRPWDYSSFNVLGTYNVVECAKDVWVKKLVYAASSFCYGIPTNILQKKRQRSGLSIPMR